jgi:hypothetical protein
MISRMPRRPASLKRELELELIKLRKLENKFFDIIKSVQEKQTETRHKILSIERYLREQRPGAQLSLDL